MANHDYVRPADSRIAAIGLILRKAADTKLVHSSEMIARAEQIDTEMGIVAVIGVLLMVLLILFAGHKVFHSEAGTRGIG